MSQDKSHGKQQSGGDALQANFSATPGKGGNSTGPKVSGSGGGNFSGGELSNKRGQQGNG